MKNFRFILLALIFINVACKTDELKPTDLDTYALLRSLTSQAFELTSLNDDNESVTLKSLFATTSTRVGDLLYVYDYGNLEIIDLARMESIMFKEYNSVPDSLGVIRHMSVTPNYVIVAFQEFSSGVITLLFIDIVTLEPTQTVMIDHRKEFYSMASIGNKVYISSAAGIEVIDVRLHNSTTQVSGNLFIFPSFYAIDNENLLMVSGQSLYKLSSTNDQITEIGTFKNDLIHIVDPRKSPVAYDNSNDKIYHIVSLPQPSPYSYYLSEYDLSSQESTALLESTYSEELDVYVDGLRSLVFDKQVKKIILAGDSKVQAVNINGVLAQEFDFSERSVEVVSVF